MNPGEAGLRLRLLGPVEVVTGGRDVVAGPPQRCAVLAALAVDAGRSVPVEVITDRVWGAAPPEGARRTLHSHIANIRRQLRRLGGPFPVVPVVRQSGGYLLELDPSQIDLHRFWQLLESARAFGLSEAEKARLLHQALGLWRGHALAGVPGQWASRMREIWQHQRVDAVVGWARAELLLGDPATVIGILTDLVEEHPLVEPLTATLMRALHAGGRNAQALELYTSIRHRLVDELGVDPSPELQQLHQAILRGEPSPGTTKPLTVTGSAPSSPSASAVMVVPAQLPTAVPGFAGRADALARLDDLLAEADKQEAAALIALVSGTAGVGKTALALHWAHRAAGHFPDGQLYINLRGFDPTGSPPVTVEEAIRMFLDAFEIPVSRIPATPQGQIALYRSVLAGRRVLVVLDNARDAAQVRPLLPGAPGCLAVITSRNQLPGLVAAEGARPIRLDLPTMDESRALMTSRIGRTRAAAETAAIDDIIRLCARLPLALVIAAARAATHHESPLAVLAKELQQSHGSLAAFSGPDSMTDVPAVFSLSYRALTGAAAQLFRLLGVHPGPDISVAAAASLAGIPPPALRPLLAELAGAHLITESSPGRYALHDLLRAYAHEQAQIHDAGKDRGDAVRRILDHYLHTAYAAAELMYRGPKLLTLTPPQRGVVPETLADHGQALAWLGAEDRVLVSVLQQAAGSGLHDFAWKLGWTVGYFFNLRGRLPEAVQVQQIALASAERLADPHAQASCHRSLGDAFTKLRSGAQASVHLRQAVDLAEQMGDHNSQAHAHLLFAILLEQQHRQPEALRHAQAAFDLYAISGESWGQARSLINIGWLNVQIGDHRQAIAQGERALELTRGLADRFGEAATWDTIGYAHFHLGNLRQAVGCYEAALGLLTDLGHRYHEATVLDHLGDADHSMGNQARARDAWQRALRILDDIDHADAPRVRAKLHGADAP